MIKKFLNFLNKDKMTNPPWDYYFLLNLDEKEYPRYLAKLFKLNTGENLPLRYDFKKRAWVIDKKRCKTFNQKIQWIKLYGVTDLMRKCTDKVAVRDYVKEKIGEEYLKPVLQICDSFDEIDFKSLPNAFVLKCNHGSKWQYIIKDKELFLNTPKLIEIVKRQLTGWLEQEYFPWNGFEMQYKNIESKLIIETLLRDIVYNKSIKINIYCFNGLPSIIIRFYNEKEITIYDEKLSIIDNIFGFSEQKINMPFDSILLETLDKSKIMSKDFNFVRIDWFVYQNKLFFEELTFTPYSGQIPFDRSWNLKLGKSLNIGEHDEYR